ncbi:uncharacterized mitochondrial protein-like protein [Tanacetum coccineum]
MCASSLRGFKGVLLGIANMANAPCDVVGLRERDGLSGVTGIEVAFDLLRDALSAIFGLSELKAWDARDALGYILDCTLKDLGELTFFLGLQVKQKEDGIFISQDKYVTKILKKFSFSDVKIASTSVETQKPLLKDEDGEDVYLYRSMIGSLMYLTSSRPDIMFVVSYTDSDYAGASLDRKSTTGGCQFLRDSNEKKLIQMIKIHTDKNVADLLTKAFDMAKKIAVNDASICRDLQTEKMLIGAIVCQMASFLNNYTHGSLRYIIGNRRVPMNAEAEIVQEVLERGKVKLGKKEKLYEARGG